VYTPEQQARLGVDANGEAATAAAKPEMVTMSLNATALGASESVDQQARSDSDAPSKTKTAVLSTGAVVGVGIAAAALVVGLIGAVVVSRRRARHARGMQLRTRAGDTVQAAQAPYSVM